MPSDSTVGDPQGFTCSSCGMFVPYGAYHKCSAPTLTQQYSGPYYVKSNDLAILAELQRISIALEKIASLLEKER